MPFFGLKYIDNNNFLYLLWLRLFITALIIFTITQKEEETMQIERMAQVSDEVIQAFNRLIPQLTPHVSPPSYKDLLEMAVSDSTFIFIAWIPNLDGKIAGMATLGTYRTPTGFHGWIEDVVVDRDYRRQGIGKALTEACLAQAKKLGLQEVNLTSRPAREAANQLYQVMGFIKRETNVYRYPIDDP